MALKAGPHHLVVVHGTAAGRGSVVGGVGGVVVRRVVVGGVVHARQPRHAVHCSSWSRRGKGKRTGGSSALRRRPTCGSARRLGACLHGWPSALLCC